MAPNSVHGAISTNRPYETCGVRSAVRSANTPGGSVGAHRRASPRRLLDAGEVDVMVEELNTDIQDGKGQVLVKVADFTYSLEGHQLQLTLQGGCLLVRVGQSLVLLTEFLQSRSNYK